MVIVDGHVRIRTGTAQHIKFIGDTALHILIQGIRRILRNAQISPLFIASGLRVDPIAEIVVLEFVLRRTPTY